MARLLPRVGRTLLLLAALVAGTPHGALAQVPFNTRFTAIAFHDVATRLSDIPPEQRADAVSTEKLIAFFDWLKAEGWHAISLDDIEAAHARVRPLPERAILITVDDGYQSVFTHYYPLALAYKMPIVAAIHTAWLEETRPDALVNYGEALVPRRRFLDWAQMREMQASGWVEFASHTHAMQSGELMAPQGSTAPAAVTRSWSTDTGHESAEVHLQRLVADLRRSHDVMTRELGKAPRALAWPFGAHTAEGRKAAGLAGFRMLFTLDPEPSDASDLMALSRFLPASDPKLGEMIDAMRFQDPLPAARRLVCMDPETLMSNTLATQPEDALEEALGATIERIAGLGATHVVLPALSAQGRAWFPNDVGVTWNHVLPRLARQLRTRAGVQVVVKLPVRDALAATGGDRDKALRLYRDLGAFVRPDALWLDARDGAAPWVEGPPDRQPADDRLPWQVRQERDRLNAQGLDHDATLSLQAWREVQASQATLALIWLADPAATRSASRADLTLVPTSSDRALTWRPPLPPGGRSESRRIGLWLETDAPQQESALIASFRRMAREGGTVFGWCPDAVPDSANQASRLNAELGTRAWLED